MSKIAFSRSIIGRSAWLVRRQQHELLNSTGHPEPYFSIFHPDHTYAAVQIEGYLRRAESWGSYEDGTLDSLAG